MRAGPTRRGPRGGGRPRQEKAGQAGATPLPPGPGTTLRVLVVGPRPGRPLLRFSPASSRLQLPAARQNAVLWEDTPPQKAGRFGGEKMDEGGVDLAAGFGKLLARCPALLVRAPTRCAFSIKM